MFYLQAAGTIAGLIVKAGAASITGIVLAAQAKKIATDFVDTTGQVKNRAVNDINEMKAKRAAKAEIEEIEEEDTEA